MGGSFALATAIITRNNCTTTPNTMCARYSAACPLNFGCSRLFPADLSRAGTVDAVLAKLGIAKPQLLLAQTIRLMARLECGFPNYQKNTYTPRIKRKCLRYA